MHACMQFFLVFLLLHLAFLILSKRQQHTESFKLVFQFISGVHLNLSTKWALKSVPFCLVGVFTLPTDEWCVHNRLFNANFEDKFK
jgi:uncharacterized membrane protein YozB (DUF420 family)